MIFFLLNAAPTLLIGPENKTLDIGDILELNCTAMSDSVYNRFLNFTWEFVMADGITTSAALNDTELEPRWEVTTVRENETYTSELRIDSVEKSDAGRYICQVHNGNPLYSLMPDAFVSVICES